MNKHIKRSAGTLAIVAGLIVGGYQQLPMKECAWCHKTFREVSLNRCHLVPQAVNPAMRDVASNVFVLCRADHLSIQHRGNWQTYNPDALEIVTKYTNSLRITGPKGEGDRHEYGSLSR
jgi:hypothetical protein